MTGRLSRLLCSVLIALLSMHSASALADEARKSDAQLLDDWVGRHVSPESVPGASAAIVHGDGRVLVRGYGLADIQRNSPVDPERTVFRVGSISKTFTALAILQLVDEGKVKLEEDANKYLKGIKIPEGSGPVRVVDLLTHRSGFDTELTYVGLDDPVAAMESSDARMQRDLYRLRPAGVVSVYDNTAWGVLGLIIESVDGVPYPTALRNRIFRPLGMTRTQVSLPADLDGVAVAYEVDPNGKPMARPHTYLRRGWQGAGDISSTAADMARFLGALLNRGEYANGHLLRKATFDRFADTKKYQFHPEIPGIGLGVYSLGGMENGAFGHAGTIRGFNAVFMVLPAQDVAVFAVMNLNRAVPDLNVKGILNYIAKPPGRTPLDPTDFMLIDLPDAIGKYFHPASADRGVVVAPSQDWSGRYAGMRMESFEGLLPRLATALLIPPQQVSQGKDGLVQIGGRGPYRPVGRDVFRLDQPAGPLFTQIGFAKAEDFTVLGPHNLQISRRLSWYERPQLTIGGLLIAPFLLLILSGIRWGFVRRGCARHEGVVLLGSAGFMLAMFCEVMWATEQIRLQGQLLLPLLWRVLAHVGLAALCWQAVLRLRSAFVAAPDGKNAGPAAKAYAGSLSILVVWLLLATLYWQVLGRFWG